MVKVMNNIFVSHF